MLSKRNFLEHEIPYDQLETLGISKKSFLNADPDIIRSFMTGGFTSLIMAEIKGQENIYKVPVKLRMERDGKGGVNLNVLPLYKTTPADTSLNLNQKDMDELKDGNIIKKNVFADNKRTTYYVQLDAETNAILKTKARDIAIPSFLKGTEITAEQRETIREGKPAEINVDEETYVIGIDLLQPTGINTIKGDLGDWQMLVAQEWDRQNPGEIGFWLTDENEWEYMQLKDSDIDIDDLKQGFDLGQNYYEEEEEEIERTMRR